MIFVDTSALYAVLDRDDENHAAAKREWSRLLAEGQSLLVTNYILVETTALVQNRLGMEAVRMLAADVLPVFLVHWISESDHGHAFGALVAAGRRKLSLVDCTSIQVMRARDVRAAFSFDPHFSEQGFTLLP